MKRSWSPAPSEQEFLEQLREYAETREDAYRREAERLRADGYEAVRAFCDEIAEQVDGVVRPRIHETDLSTQKRMQYRVTTDEVFYEDVAEAFYSMYVKPWNHPAPWLTLVFKYNPEVYTRSEEDVKSALHRRLPETVLEDGPNISVLVFSFEED